MIGVTSRILSARLRDLRAIVDPVFGLTSSAERQENDASSNHAKTKYLLYPKENVLELNRRTGCGPSGDQERMTCQSFGSDRLKATRPSQGAAKLAPRPKAVNQLSGGR